MVMHNLKPLVTVVVLISILSLTYSQLVRVPLRKNKKLESKQSLLNLNINSDPIGIHNTANEAYTGTIEVGSQRKPFTVSLDTGSDIFWIRDSNTSYINTYDCIQADSCQANISDIANITYGGGTITGYKATTMITIGGLTISNFNTMLVYAFNPDPSSGNDGILGFSTGRFSNDYPPIIEALKDNELISNGMFSMYLGNKRDSSGEITGELIFGGYDAKYATGDFQYVEIVDPQTWLSRMMAVGLGDETNISTYSNFTALFDTGSSFLLLPPTFIEGLLNQANNLGFGCANNTSDSLIYCSCDAQKSLPDLIFYFNNFSVNIPASSYIYASDKGCFLTIGPQTYDNSVILGDAFLINFYTIYDFDNHLVGLAKAALPDDHPSNPPSSHTLLIVLIILGVVCLIMIGLYLYKTRKNNNENKVPSHDQFYSQVNEGNDTI